MSPYLRAHAAYHARGEPQIPWTIAMDWHLQHGLLWSDDRCFVMCRRVEWDEPEHAILEHHPNPTDGDWHIWAAAGDLGAILNLGDLAAADRVSFQRRDGRLHRWSFDGLMRRFASPAIAT